MTIKQKQLGGITELDKDGYGVINVNGARIRNVGAPIDGYDVAVKAYVQQVVSESGGGGGGVTDHGALTGLSDDDHTQYVHNTAARTISARHTFNPGTTNSPFIIGANATNQLVLGLNADKVDGNDSTAFLYADGSVNMSGNLNANNNKIINLATPTLSTDAVTKTYVDGYSGWKNINIASNANIDISKLAAGTDNYLLKVISGTPTWVMDINSYFFKTNSINIPIGVAYTNIFSLNSFVSDGFSILIGTRIWHKTNTSTRRSEFYRFHVAKSGINYTISSEDMNLESAGTSPQIVDTLDSGLGIKIRIDSDILYFDVLQFTSQRYVQVFIWKSEESDV
jgi:hypothetical protein